MTETSNPSSDLQTQIEAISNQLCLAVKGDFSFTIQSHTTEASIQKLSMLLNFVMDTARRALDEVKEQNAKLTELDKLKTDFMANISHELRTPLTLILAPLESILSQTKGDIPQEYKENLKRMYRNAIRLYMLVNDLLDLSKLEAGKFVVHDDPIDLNQVLSQIIEDSEDLAKERGIKLTFAPCPKLENMLLDLKMVEKIVLNLISNALKFTPEGGTVQVQLKKEDKTVKLSIKDSGIGIPESQINHLFERFHQVDSSSTRDHEGTGIGLALISEFVKIMNGKIEVGSQIGKGSTFTISLPIRPIVDIIKNSSEKTKNPPFKINLSKFSSAENLPPEQKNKQNIKNTDSLPLILIADDNQDMRTYITSLLHDTFEVIAVSNGKLALEAIRKVEPQVILSDIMMPEMNGFELTRALKSDPITQHIPIILLSAKAGKEAIIEGLDVGADDYLPKPFSPEELKARAHSALRLNQNYMNIRNLNTQLKAEILQRESLEVKNKAINDQLITAARRAGMAEIATSVLHNIGNVLNSINTSATVIKHKLDKSKVSNLSEIAKLLEDHKADMTDFMINTPQGQRLPAYLLKLSDTWMQDKESLRAELNALEQGIQHVKEIITKQNSLSSTLSIVEPVNISDIIEDALSFNQAVGNKTKVDIIRKIGPLKEPVIDRTKLLQIIVNLVKNGIESVIKNNPDKKQIILNVQEETPDKFRIQISDNGVGILSENMPKIFNFGFTTKETGHGFGLHSCALSVKEMGGDFMVDSKGAGQGATFTLILPYKPPKKMETLNA